MQRKIDNEKLRRRTRRAGRVRKTIAATTTRPRLSVFRSAKHIYAQVIDDVQGKTLCTASTLTPDLKDAIAGKKKSDKAELVGKKVAQVAVAAGISEVVFDRGGFPYHGRIAALAKGAREGGLKF